MRAAETGFGALWVCTKGVGHPPPLWGRGPRCTPGSSQPQGGLPKPSPRRGRAHPWAAVLRPPRDRARWAPRDPIAGLGGGGGGMRSSRTAATAPGGPHHRPPPISGAGGEAGAPAAVGAARTRVRGRDEADQRQTCRRWFIGDAQRLWRYVTSPPTPPIPPPGLGEMSGSPPHSPLYSTLTSSRHGSGTPGQGVWSQHMPGWCPPPLKKNVK